MDSSQAKKPPPQPQAAAAGEAHDAPAAVAGASQLQLAQRHNAAAGSTAANAGPCQTPADVAAGPSSASPPACRDEEVVVRVLARLRALHAEGIPALSRHDVLARLTGLTELTLDSVATPKTLTVLPLLRSLTLRRLLVVEGLQALHVGGRAAHASQPRMHAACCMLHARARQRVARQAACVCEKHAAAPFMLHGHGPRACSHQVRGYRAQMLTQSLAAPVHRPLALVRHGPQHMHAPGPCRSHADGLRCTHTA